MTRYMKENQTCADCGWPCDIEYAERIIPRQQATPSGWKRTETRGSWAWIERPTGWQSLCNCY